MERRSIPSIESDEFKVSNIYPVRKKRKEKIRKTKKKAFQCFRLAAIRHGVAARGLAGNSGSSTSVGLLKSFDDVAVWLQMCPSTCQAGLGVMQ